MIYCVQVTVHVSGLGDSSSMIIADVDRRFALLPSISSITPTRGSLSGGTLLTIAGRFIKLTVAIAPVFYQHGIQVINCLCLCHALDII